MVIPAQYLTDDSSDYSILWQAKAVNAMGQVVGEVLRNGVETTINRNAATGWMMSSQSVAHFDSNKIIQDWSYTFDMAGNLLSRNREDQVNDATSTEAFTYDPLNRLLTSDVRVQNANSYHTSDSFSYDPLGNITLKAGNTYTYNSGCMTDSHLAGPNAVCTVGLGDTVYRYDDNGNMVSGGNHSVTYNPTGRVTHIETTNGSPDSSVDFVYGSDGHRVVQNCD